MRWVVKTAKKYFKTKGFEDFKQFCFDLNLSRIDVRG